MQEGNDSNEVINMRRKIVNENAGTNVQYTVYCSKETQEGK